MKRSSLDTRKRALAALDHPAAALGLGCFGYAAFPSCLTRTRGLHVSRNATSGFQVRETEHGRATLEFDYRIVAHPVSSD
ncbi:MAG: hypothetical protein ABSF08_07345 [Candidatus Cybelea sp.]